MKVSIIGAGKLGGALAVALSENGYTIEYLVARNIQNAEKIVGYFENKPEILSPDELSKITSEIVFITTQDFEIENAAHLLAKKLQTKPFVFHTSGSLSSDVLQNLKAIGSKIGSIHPLISISDSILGAKRFESAYFCVEGDQSSVKIAEKIVSDLKGKSFRIPTERKMLYHAAAVTASGHLVALFDTAIEMLSKCGLNSIETQEIFLPLVKSTVENLQAQTTSQALTGPFARADVITFEKHLQILHENISTDSVEVYLQLALRSVQLAELQGANRERLSEILEKIKLAKKNLK